MNLHEYQAKRLLAEEGVPVPHAIPAFSVREAVNQARELGGGRLGRQSADPRWWAR